MTEETRYASKGKRKYMRSYIRFILQVGREEGNSPIYLAYFCRSLLESLLDPLIIFMEPNPSSNPHNFILFWKWRKVVSGSRWFLLTSCTEGKMLLGTALGISFDEKVFLLIVACNLFHKAAFINFMFLKHCRKNLWGLKYKTSLVITLDIHFLEKAFLLITRCNLSRKPGIMSFNVPTNLFWIFAQIWVWNSIKQQKH